MGKGIAVDRGTVTGAPQTGPETGTTPELRIESIGSRSPAQTGPTMTPEQRQAVQSQMNEQLRQSNFGQAYVPLLSNSAVTIAIAPTGPGALGTTEVRDDNHVAVTLSQEAIDQTYGELLGKGLSQEEAVRMTALKMLPVYVHELQHAKNDVAQIAITGTNLTATPREEEATGWAAGAQMYAEQLRDPVIGPQISSVSTSLDGKLENALQQWKSGLETLEQVRGWKGRYSIRNQEFDTMQQLTREELGQNQGDAQRVLSQVNRENFGQLAEYYNQEYRRLAPPK